MNAKIKTGISVASAVLILVAALAGCSQTMGSPSSSQEEAGSALSDTGAEDSGEPSAGTQPVVYMTTNLTSDGLMAVYQALEAAPTGNIAVKLSTGEPGSNYLRTDLIGELVQSFDHPTIVECNTAYGGSRANTAMHYQVAEDHGYTAIADVDIMDENGSMTLPVPGEAI